MRIIPFLIEQLAHLVAGNTEFSAMRSLVQHMESSELSGAEKREMVLNDFEQIGYDIGGWVVNLLLELAVAWIKEKAA